VSDLNRLLKAAADAETLSKQLHEVAEELKNGLDGGSEETAYTGPVNYAYWRLYHIRTDLGRVVASLGVGVPRRIKR
jgi:hypothetical protein